MEKGSARKITGVLLATLLIPIVPFVIIGELPGERWLQAQGGNALIFGATGAALLALDVVLPIPSSIVGTLLAARLGFLPGLAWAFAGLMLGNLAGYGGGRFLLGRIGGELPSAPTAVAVLLSRPVPVLAEAIAFAAGAFHMRFSRFVVLAAAGNAAYAVALAAGGAALLPQAWAGPGLAIPLGVPVAGWLIWKRLERRGKQRHGSS